MPPSSAIALRSADPVAEESRDRIPVEVARLLAADPGPATDYAWEAFVARYSGLLLKVSFTFAQGYDGALDRYTFMLDELRRSNCRRLRGFAADGRGRFSTWLAVVARRLCLDHYRHLHGRFRGTGPDGGRRSLVQAARRGLAQLDGTHDLAQLPAPMSMDPADGMDERDRQEALSRVVATLPPGDQLLLRLRFEQELTAREMAAVLGLPSPFHVYRRLEAVFRQMRAQLGQGSVPAAAGPAAGSGAAPAGRSPGGAPGSHASGRTGIIPPRATAPAAAQEPSGKVRPAAEGRKCASSGRRGIGDR
jgi:RNA polymerase sigma factor (sigma-70 family)